jgi:hypothetical protein
MVSFLAAPEALPPERALQEDPQESWSFNAPTTHPATFITKRVKRVFSWIAFFG